MTYSKPLLIAGILLAMLFLSGCDMDIVSLLDGDIDTVDADSIDNDSTDQNTVDGDSTDQNTIDGDTTDQNTIDGDSTDIQPIENPWDFTATSSNIQLDNGLLYLLKSNILVIYEVDQDQQSEDVGIKASTEITLPYGTWNFIVNDSRIIAITKTYLYFFTVNDKLELQLISKFDLQASLPDYYYSLYGEYGMVIVKGFSVRNGLLYLPTSYERLFRIDIRNSALPKYIDFITYYMNDHDNNIDYNCLIERSPIILQENIAVQYEYLYDMDFDENHNTWRIISFDDDGIPEDRAVFSNMYSYAVGPSSTIRINGNYAMVLWYYYSYDIEDTSVSLINLTDAANPITISTVELKDCSDEPVCNLFRDLSVLFLYGKFAVSIAKYSTGASLCYGKFISENSLSPLQCKTISSPEDSGIALTYILDGDTLFVVWANKDMMKYDLKSLLK